jgi:subtilisin family serine protease
MMGVFLERRFPGWDPSGNWRLRIHGRLVTDGQVHAWIERDNVNPSQFAPPHDNTHTIGSISCGQKTIVVGSYDAHKTSRPLSFFSSAGPTRDQRRKPEVAAPGHAVLAAHSRTTTGVVRKSGTSMAAPAVAGVIALVYAEAQARNLDLDIDQLRSILQDATRRNPPYGSDWDDRYGFGRLSAERAVQGVIDMAESAPSPVAGEPPGPTKKKSAKKKSAKKRSAKKKSVSTKSATKKAARKRSKSKRRKAS